MARHQTFFLLLAIVLLSHPAALQDSCNIPENVPETILIASLYAGPNEKPFETAFFLAIENINNDPCVLPGTTLTGVANLTTTPVEGLEAYLFQAQVLKATAIIGARSSGISRAVATASPLFETPQISFASTMAELSNIETYPYFNRVVPSDAFQGKLLARLFDKFGWDRVAVLFTSAAYGASIAETFTNEATSLGVRFLSTQSFPRKAPIGSEELISAVSNTKRSGAKIIFMAMLSDDAHRVLRTAIDLGLTGVNFVVADGSAQKELFYDPATGELVQEVFDSSVGILGLIPKQAHGPVYEKFLEQWATIPAEDGGVVEPPLYVPFKYDATMAVALALDRVVKRGLDPATNGPELLEEIRFGPAFDGLTGSVSFDEYGDRLANYDILNHRGDHPAGFEVIGSANEESIDFATPPIFHGHTFEVPDSAHLTYVDYDSAVGKAMIALCSLGIATTIVSAVIVLSHRKTAIVAFSSPRFVCMIALGIILGYCNVFVWTGKPTQELCLARPWILLMGYSIVLGNLYAKTSRIYYLMSNKSFVSKPIKDERLFSFVALYSIFFIIPLIVWTAAFPLDAVRKNSNPDNEKANVVCDGESAEAFFFYFLIISIISIVFGVVISFLIRNIHDFFSEAEYIGYTLYTTCITVVVVLPMLFLLDDDPEGFYIVFVLGVFFANSAALIFLFFPKMFVIVLHPEQNVVPMADGRIQTSKVNNKTNMTYDDD